MDTNKVIVTLLVLTIILSVATVAFNAFAGQKTSLVNNLKGRDTATVGLYVEGGQANGSKTTENSQVGLYVESE